MPRNQLAMLARSDLMLSTISAKICLVGMGVSDGATPQASEQHNRLYFTVHLIHTAPRKMGAYSIARHDTSATTHATERQTDPHT